MDSDGVDPGGGVWDLIRSPVPIIHYFLSVILYQKLRLFELAQKLLP